MSTAATTPNPAQVTPPSPETMPLTDLRAQIANPTTAQPAPEPALPPTPAPAPATPPSSEPFKIVKTTDGFEIQTYPTADKPPITFKGTTLEEAAGKLAASSIEASRTITELRKSPAAPQHPEPTPASAQGFSTQAVAEKYAAVDLSKISAADFNALYYSALASDVGEAQALANARSNGFRTVGDFYQAMGQMQETTEATIWRDLSVQFSAAAPDFPHTAEAANVLGDIMEKAGIVQPTVENMKMAWAYAKSEGKIKPLSQEEIAAQRSGSFSQPKAVTPPPVIPSNQQSIAREDTSANAYAMPIGDLKKLLLQAQANKQ